jgi:hypothetical protein
MEMEPVWYNRGRRDIGGSRFWWEPAGVRFEGAVAGSCTYFPDLNGDGLADMHAITHSMTNTAETWYNGCRGGVGKDHTGDDDGGNIDPNLPEFPQDDDIPLAHYKDGSCSREMVKAILHEIGIARDMAREAQTHLQKDDYYDKFFPQAQRDDSEFKDHVTTIFGRVAEMLNGRSGNNFLITCKKNAKRCQDPDYIAGMGKKAPVLNFCPTFLTHLELISASVRKSECKYMTHREAHRTRAAIILHEVTHTIYAMKGTMTGDIKDA